MNEYKPQKPHILFRTPEQLQRYLEGAGSAELRFRAYPISGEPETYNYSSGEKTVTRETDGMSFDSLDDFTMLFNTILRVTPARNMFIWKF